MSKEKDNLCQYMTPPEVCKLTLDKAGYTTRNNIAELKVLEPSFGTGNFLVEIIERLRSISQTPQELKGLIQSNIFGIEKDNTLYTQTINRLNKLLRGYGIVDFDWSNNMYCTNTLTKYKDFIGIIDLVVGNPPFVRIHNCTKEERTLLNDFELCTGNTDLYIAFYELGMKCLKDSGKLALITPYTWLKTTSQKDFRKWLYQNDYLEQITLFGEKDLWKEIVTYPCINVLSKTPVSSIGYERYEQGSLLFKDSLTREDFNNLIAKNPFWTIATRDKLEKLKEIYDKPLKLKDIAEIKESICTNANKVYVHRVWEYNNQDYRGLPTDKRRIVYLDRPYPEGMPIESDILYRCIKATTYVGKPQGTYIIYPYRNNELIDEETLRNEYPLAYEYLNSQKELLLKRDLRNGSPWYAFGRSQGLNQIGKDKITFKQVLNPSNKIKAYQIPRDMVTYNGTWSALTEEAKREGYNLIEILESDDFKLFATETGRVKQGGYVELKNKQLGNFGIQNKD